MEIRPLSRAEDGEAELEWVALLNSPKMNKSSTKGTSEAGTAGSISPPPHLICYFNLKSIIEIRILSEGLTLILWTSIVFIFHSIGGRNSLQSFQALKFSIGSLQPEAIKAQRGQVTFLRAHSKSVAEED